MKRVNDHIRDNLLKDVNLNDSLMNKSIEELKRISWSPEFETLMRNRLLVGAFRYGLLNEEGKPAFDSVGSAIKRLELYLETGNTEHLVDAANLCLVEFVEGKHPKKHFKAEDDGEHTQTLEDAIDG